LQNKNFGVTLKIFMVFELGALSPCNHF
jgi:hypothetical protein